MSERVLRLAPDLALPLEAVTETFGILATRGAGKSNLARVLAEEMVAAHLPFVAIDPVGAWWGLRSSRDGAGPGLPIPVFGGKRGDVPLERGGGQLIADLVVDRRLTCVLDLSLFESEAAKKAFLLDFARRLYQRNEYPLHLFLEEADDYIPQQMRGAGDERRIEPQLLRAFENLVRRGRARGLGMTMITQRSAALNKNVLEMVQTLFVLRTTGPRDREAIRKWVQYHDVEDKVLESLPGLADGDAWVWSPDFLRLTRRFHARLSRTFDSGATPKMGKGGAAPAPATLADVDLAEITARMADTIARAKHEDPKELRKQVAALKAEIGKLQRGRGAPVATKPVADPAAITAAVEKAIAQRDRDYQRREQQRAKALGALVRQLSTAHAQLASVVGIAERVATELTQLVETNGHVPIALQPARIVSAAETKPRPVNKAPAVSPASPSRESEASLPKGERLILTAVAQYPDGVSREQLSVLTGYKRSSRDTYLQRLSAAGYVNIAGGTITATDAAIEALGDFEPLPTGAALLAYWRDRLPEGERRVLDTAVEAWPEAIARESIDEATGYKRSSRDTYLQRLGSRKLITTERGKVKASDTLFD